MIMSVDHGRVDAFSASNWPMGTSLVLGTAHRPPRRILPVAAANHRLGVRDGSSGGGSRRRRRRLLGFASQEEGCSLRLGPSDLHCWPGISSLLGPAVSLPIAIFRPLAIWEGHCIAHGRRAGRAAFPRAVCSRCGDLLLLLLLVCILPRGPGRVPPPPAARRRRRGQMTARARQEGHILNGQHEPSEDALPNCLLAVTRERPAPLLVVAVAGRRQSRPGRALPAEGAPGRQHLLPDVLCWSNILRTDRLFAHRPLCSDIDVCHRLRCCLELKPLRSPIRQERLRKRTR
mmetsp:Transcript_57200/g.145264  ORF Transcript_57200/g.145264 Transcript_57200/m.145264 type:complete len:289 (-) Transcript_57200:151-1017(-)